MVVVSLETASPFAWIKNVVFVLVVVDTPVVRVNVNTTLPDVSIPVIALSTVIALVPIATTVVPAATTDAPPVDVTTSPNAMF